MNLYIIALLYAIALCLGWLVGYAMGKAVARRRPVLRVPAPPPPETVFVTRLNSRHATQEFHP